MHGCTGVVGLLFLAANRADKLDVGDVFVLVAGNFGFVNKLDGVGASNASSYTLGETAKFIGG